VLLLLAAGAIVNACSSSTDGSVHGSAGAAGTGASAAGATSSANAGAAGQASAGATASANAGAAGEVSAGAADELTAGAAGQGETGGAGGARNIFVDQVVLEQGGGPPRCLPRSLPEGRPASAGQVSCSIAEFKAGSCDCTQAGRTALSAVELPAFEQKLMTSGACGGTSGVRCDTFCGCEIQQTSGADLDACQNDLTPAATANGFCVIDLMHTDENGAPAPLGNPALVSQCPANEKRLLRFVNAGQPAPDATLFIGCWN
jgi:hypothetical protein